MRSRHLRPAEAVWQRNSATQFLFPIRKASTYDTPADALFARTGRAQPRLRPARETGSTGGYLLRDDPNWDEERIQTTMHQDEERHVAMKESCRCTSFFTAWPDGTGGVQTFRTYGYDAKQSASPAARARGGVKLGCSWPRRRGRHLMSVPARASWPAPRGVAGRDRRAASAAVRPNSAERRRGVFGRGLVGGCFPRHQSGGLRSGARRRGVRDVGLVT